MSVFAWWHYPVAVFALLVSLYGMARGFRALGFRVERVDQKEAVQSKLGEFEDGE